LPQTRRLARYGERQHHLGAPVPCKGVNVISSRLKMKIVTLSLLGGGIAAGALLAFSSPAGAATTTPPVPEAITGYNYNSIWAGNYKLDDGEFPVYCVTAYAAYPTGSYTAAQGVAASTDGSRISWVIENYGKSTDPNVEAAVAALVGKYFDTVNTNEKWGVISAGQMALANQYWADATEYAGPYTMSVNLPASTDQGATATGTVSVLAASGDKVPNITLTLSSSNATLTTTSVNTGASGTASFTYTIPLSDTGGSYQIRAVGDLVDKVVTYAPTGGGAPRQTVMGTADPTTYASNPSATYVPVRPVDIVKYRTGTTTAVAGATYELETSTGAAVSSVVTSSAPVQIASLGVGTSYQLVETSAPAGYYIASAAPVTFTVAAGTSAQLVTVSDPAVPTIQIATSVTTKTLTLGGTSTDNVTITGNNGESGTLTGRLYGPLAVPTGGCASISASQWAGAATYDSPTVSISPTSSSDSLTAAISEYGCFSWADSVTLSPSQATASSPVGQSAETFLVPGPSFLTAATNRNVIVGGSASDVVTVTLPSGSSGTLTGVLYGPLAEVGGSCSSLNWTGAPEAGTISPLPVSTSSKVTTSSVAVASVGCYSFGETLTLSNGQSISSTPGTSAETVLVSSVPVTTLPVTRSTVPQVISGGGGAPGPWNEDLILGLLLVGVGAVGAAALRRRFL
jgi:hypothetical protein